MKFREHFAAVLGFLTVFPIRKSYPLELVSEGIYLFPVVGFLLGGLAGVAEFWLMRFLPHLLAATLGLGLLLGLSGFSHLDGLADFGDGLMCVGDKERKIQAMRDTAVGTGGVGLVVLVVLASVGALSGYTPRESFLALILAETFAKHSMTTLAFLGRPASPGMSTSFFEAMDERSGRYRFAASTAVTLVLGYLFGGTSGLVGFGAALVASVAIILVSNREFGGLTGDVFGAANEITRLSVLVVLLGVAR